MQISICVEKVFSEYPFLERLMKVAKSGFRGFEFWRWRDRDISSIRRMMDKYDLQVMSISGHEGGSLFTEQEAKTYLADAQEAIKVASELGCDTLIFTTGESSKKTFIPEVERRSNLAKYFKQIAKMGEDHNFTMVLEPLNTLVDHPGYYINSSRLGFEIIDEVGSEHLKLLYDIYHMQIMEGNLISTISKNIEKIGYFHVADVPGRHEPGTGEINYVNIRHALVKLGYNGTVGFEFTPPSTPEKAMEAINPSGCLR